MTPTLTVYLRNGLSFTFAPRDAALANVPSDKQIAEMLASDAATSVDNAEPRIVIRWSDVVAVRIDQPPTPGGTDAEAPKTDIARDGRARPRTRRAR
jgi:hypothetical protein